MRKWWTDRYTPEEIRSLAAAVWPDVAPVDCDGPAE